MRFLRQVMHAGTKPALGITKEEGRTLQIPHDEGCAEYDLVRTGRPRGSRRMTFGALVAEDP